MQVPDSLQVQGSLNVSSSTPNPNFSDLDEDFVQAQQKIAQVWIENNGQDFAAHAVWKGNLPSIIEDGAVRPAEAVLRQKGQAEYEMGMYKQRGKIILPNLSEEDLRALEELDPEMQEQLEFFSTLQSKDTLERKEHLELEKMDSKALEKESFTPENLGNLQEALEGAAKEKNEEKMKEIQENIFQLRMEYIKTLPSEDQKKYEELARKEWLGHLGYKILHTSIPHTRHGINFEFNSVEVRKHSSFPKRKGSFKMKRPGYSVNHNRRNKLNDLCEKYNTTIDAIEICYDQKRNNYLDKHLAHKYEKWTKKGVDQDIIDQALYGVRNPNSHLKVEVRTEKNGIRWSYGNTVILRGKTESISTHSHSTKDKCELLLLAPWENKGEFFSLPLAQEDTLIIGPREELEPHRQRLGELGARYVFTESLSPEQNKLFETPKNLRNPDEPEEIPEVKETSAPPVEKISDDEDSSGEEKIEAKLLISPNSLDGWGDRAYEVKLGLRDPRELMPEEKTQPAEIKKSKIDETIPKAAATPAAKRWLITRVALSIFRGGCFVVNCIFWIPKKVVFYSYQTIFSPKRILQNSH